LEREKVPDLRVLGVAVAGGVNQILIETRLRIALDARKI
jgi:hypothetical protein